jgi:hypothetical protein
MSTLTTKDCTQPCYNDWDTGQPVVFSTTSAAPREPPAPAEPIAADAVDPARERD